MKKLILLVLFLFAGNLIAKDIYETDIIFDKDINATALAKASYSFTMPYTSDLCVRPSTNLGATWKYDSDVFTLGCDSVLFTVEAYSKTLIGQSLDSLSIIAKLVPLTPGGRQLPTDTSTWLGQPITVLMKYAGQGSVATGAGAIATWDNAIPQSAQLSCLHGKLVIFIGQGNVRAQTLHVRIWMTKVWKDRR